MQCVSILDAFVLTLIYFAHPQDRMALTNGGPAHHRNGSIKSFQDVVDGSEDDDGGYPGYPHVGFRSPRGKVNIVIFSGESRASFCLFDNSLTGRAGHFRYFWIFYNEILIEGRLFK